MSDQNGNGLDESRRRALVKLGAFAAFTVPTVTTLLLSDKATAQSATVGGGSAPGSVSVGPGGGEVCVGGNNSCP